MANKISLHLGLLRSTVDLQLSSIESYHDQISHILSQEVREFETKIKEFPEPEDDDMGQYDSFIGDYISLRDHYPQVLRSSILISLYSLFEHSLFFACQSLQRAHDLKFSAKDFSGTGIDQAKRYIKKGIGVDFPDQTTEWQAINNVRKIRNTIIHEQGRIYESRDNSELEKAVNAVEHVSIENGQILVGHKFGRYFGGIISKFFGGLIAGLISSGNPVSK